MILLHRTSVGDFAIVRNEDMRYEVMLDGEPLGTYDEAAEAAEALCSGEVFQPRGQQLDFDMLDIPRNILEWEYLGS